MAEIEVSRTRKIVQLHQEIGTHLRTSLVKAIEIGRLLTEQKEALPHGEFGRWVERNLPFTDRTARNYMRLHEERDRLKTETVSDLEEAYRLLRQPKLPPAPLSPTELEALRPIDALFARIAAEAAEIGKMLCYVKGQLPPGEWQDWISDNLDFSAESAQTYLDFHARVVSLGRVPVEELLRPEWRELLCEASR